VVPGVAYGVGHDHADPGIGVRIWLAAHRRHGRAADGGRGYRSGLLPGQRDAGEFRTGIQSRSRHHHVAAIHHTHFDNRNSVEASALAVRALVVRLGSGVVNQVRTADAVMPGQFFLIDKLPDKPESKAGDRDNRGSESNGAHRE